MALTILYVPYSLDGGRGYSKVRTHTAGAPERTLVAQRFLYNGLAKPEPYLLWLQTFREGG